MNVNCVCGGQYSKDHVAISSYYFPPVGWFSMARERGLLDRPRIHIWKCGSCGRTVEQRTHRKD